jgi:anti-sigma factor RsiW
MILTKDDELLVNAYLDGELDPIEANRFEQRLASEPALAAEIESYRLLRTALRSNLAEDMPSDDLRRRIMSGLDLRVRRRVPAWGALAASFLAGAVLAGSITLGVLRHQTGQEIAIEVVSAHIRSLIAPAPADVPSSDHHTVKPWFNGKLAFAPVVPDLGGQGYPLVGARVDVIGLEPAATLVYARGKHLISLTEIPNGQAPAAPARSYEERGFLALSWSAGGVTYFAVSDAAADELEAFVKLVQAEAAGNGRS